MKGHFTEHAFQRCFNFVLKQTPPWKFPLSLANKVKIKTVFCIGMDDWLITLHMRTMQSVAIFGTGFTFYIIIGVLSFLWLGLCRVFESGRRSSYFFGLHFYRARPI